MQVTASGDAPDLLHGVEHDARVQARVREHYREQHKHGNQTDVKQRIVYLRNPVTPEHDQCACDEDSDKIGCGDRANGKYLLPTHGHNMRRRGHARLRRR